MAGRSLLLLFAGMLAVNAAPMNNNHSPIQTVYATVTKTIAMAVTRTLPCLLETPMCRYTDEHGNCHQGLPHCERTEDGCHHNHHKYDSAHLQARHNDETCGAYTGPACPDGNMPACECRWWGWDCNCSPGTGETPVTKTTVMCTETLTLTNTYFVDNEMCLPTSMHTESPEPEPTNEPEHTHMPQPTQAPGNGGDMCPPGKSYEVITFDDVFDGVGSHIREAVRKPESPFEYHGFTFDPDWAFALCENMNMETDNRSMSCNASTTEGKYFVSLYYQLAKEFISRVSRRITYDLYNPTSSWEILSYSLTAFPKPGQTITILLCAWSVEDQDTDIEPTFCHAEYFAEADKNIRREVKINNKDQKLAFVEFTSYDDYYAVGTRGRLTEISRVAPRDEKAKDKSKDKGLRAVEFLLEDMAVCIPHIEHH
ncbi:hypothetical protein BZA77DRAFT_14480 [Pyronema omphalodes]|nr:hypothetical protein BZA77DRAFT_14480 [Pyronema omphalodes]